MCEQSVIFVKKCIIEKFIKLKILIKFVRNLSEFFLYL
jgi:hypothetical protein